MSWYVFHPDLNMNTCRIKVKLFIIIDGPIIINLVNINVKLDLIYI
jgi:hypothetical protein